MEHDILQIAKAHLNALAEGKAGDELAEYFSLNIKQIEYPNRLNPNGAVSDYKTMLERSEKGKKIITSQAYNIKREYVVGYTVILEVEWTGIFAVPLGQIKPGQPLKAHFALFMEFENGKIIKQRNYDCFEAF